jgi:putative peptidoglycan binding protein
METQEHDSEHEIIAEDLSEDEAVQIAEVEGDDCEAVSEEEGVEADDADDFSSIDDEDDTLEGLSPRQFLAPGGDWGGSEAPVRRAIKIARANGLTVTSTKRSTLSTGSDHHVSQTRAFAADLSNGSSPTPQMDRTAHQIAAALGRPSFRAGVLAVVSGPVRAQLLWRTHVGGNHFNHVHFGVRVSGSGHGGGGSGHPRLTDPLMRGETVRRIQRRLLALGFKPLEVDGVFGKQTDSAVRRFQKDRKLHVDGVVGPKTRAALG